MTAALLAVEFAFWLWKLRLVGLESFIGLVILTVCAAVLDWGRKR